MGHLIIDGGYACMIETSEAVDVVALKNPCSHLNLCPLILFSTAIAIATAASNIFQFKKTRETETAQTWQKIQTMVRSWRSSFYNQAHQTMSFL